MAEQNGFDMEAYIDKRMLEISQLEERVLYKEIVGELMKELHRYNVSSYQRLEDRVLSETKSEQSDYAIYIGLTDREHYDATDGFLQPIQIEDTEKREIQYAEVQEALENHTELKLYSVFIKTGVANITRLLQENREFYGVIRTENREYKGTFRLKRAEVYLDKIKELYDIFAANYRSWITVCEAYLMKMFDVYLCTAEEMKEEEQIQEIRVDFEEYADMVRYEMIPLWNLTEYQEKTSVYPEPAIDKINYEHQIFAHRLKADCEYLVRDMDVEITNIRRMKGDLFITCPVERPCEWNMYQINKPDGKARYQYPVLSNQYKESFSGSITEMFRRSIKTKAEMARLIESFGYENYVVFKGFSIEERLPEELKRYNYNMDGFIQDEIRIGNGRQALVITFAVVDKENYLNEDIMSFLVTQVQKIFPEYMCAGRLV